MKSLLSLMLILLMGSLSWAQNDYNWNESKNKHGDLARWSYAGQLIQAKRFAEAKTEIDYFLAELPNLDEDLYKQAITVYEGLERDEKDPTKKTAFQDTVLNLYDKRLSLYNNEAYVLDRKGRVAFPYLTQRSNYDAEALFQLYKRIIELNGNNTYTYNIYYYYWLLANVQKAQGKATDEDLDASYDLVTDILNAQQQQYSGKASKLKQIDYTRQQVNYYYKEKRSPMDCATLGKRYGEEVNDLATAKKIQSAMKSKCEDDALYLQALETIFNQEPNTAICQELGVYYQKKGMYSKAIAVFNKGAELSSSSQEKAGFNLSIAQLYQQKGDKNQARVYARQCISQGYYTKEAYKLIGDLYLFSYNDCNGKDIVKTRSIYIAAYNMYEKAGNEEGMRKAEEQFPSAEEIFLQNKKVGDEVNTGCWINETVKLRKR